MTLTNYHTILQLS